MRPIVKSISYTSGSIPANLVSLAFTTYVQFYYIDVLKGDAAWIGLAATVQAVYATVIYPFLGYLSDRTYSQWGRRVPFIVYGSIPLAVAFILVWAPPFTAAHQLALTLYFFVTALLYDTLFNLTMVNWSALFPELFHTPTERASASAWKQMFGIVGLITGLALPPMLAQSMGWPVMGATFGLLSAITLLTTFPSLELRRRSRSADAATSPAVLPIRQALRHTLWNRSFLTFVAMRFFVQFAFTLLTADLSFYAKYDLLISGQQQSLILLGTLAVALPLVYVWGWIIPRIGAFASAVCAMSLFGAVLVRLGLIHTFRGALTCGLALGLGLSGILVLTDVLISDVIDEDELKTGTRREGMYYGIHGLVVSLCAPAQALITTLVLVTTGYTHTGPQPASALEGFRWLITAIPLLALFVGLLVFLGYPLRTRYVDEVQRRLRQKRQHL